MTANERYADYPDHPLHEVPQAVLDVVRANMGGVAVWKDIADDLVVPVADSCVQALVEAGYRIVTGPCAEEELRVYARLIIVDLCRALAAHLEGDACEDWSAITYDDPDEALAAAQEVSALDGGRDFLVTTEAP